MSAEYVKTALTPFTATVATLHWRQCSLTLQPRHSEGTRTQLNGLGSTYTLSASVDAILRVVLHFNAQLSRSVETPHST